jgi:F-type H+-transporting ATPase subunit epsilon
VAASFEVFLVTPEREIWSGQATMVIARGTEGEVGVLAGHAPMLIQLAIGPLLIDPVEGERVAVAIDGGFLHVVSYEGETRMDVLAEQAELREEIRHPDRPRRLGLSRPRSEAVGSFRSLNQRLFESEASPWTGSSTRWPGLFLSAID